VAATRAWPGHKCNLGSPCDGPYTFSDESTSRPRRAPWLTDSSGRTRSKRRSTRCCGRSRTATRRATSRSRQWMSRRRRAAVAREASSNPAVGRTRKLPGTRGRDGLLRQHARWGCRHSRGGRDGTRIGTDIDPDWLRHRIWELTDRRLTVHVRIVDLDGTRLLVLATHEAIEPIRHEGRIRWRSTTTASRSTRRHDMLASSSGAVSTGQRDRGVTRSRTSALSPSRSLAATSEQPATGRRST
jgi:hypothetical protein